MDVSKYGITRLNPTTYVSWAVKMKHLLTLKECYAAVLDAEHPASDKALSIIGMAVC